MTIGIDCHSLEGQRTGVGRYLFNLIKRWDSFALPVDLQFILYFKQKIPKNIPKNKRFKSKILKSKSNALFIHYYLPGAAKKDKLDILFCPGYVAPIFYKGKIALTLHDIIYEARPDLYDWPSVFDKILLKRVSRISAKKAKIIFTCSKFSKDEIIKYYKIKAEKIFFIPLAVDEKLKDVGSPTSNIKTKYGIEDRFIFYIGSVFKRRYIPETIRAFLKISEKLPNYQFLIIGKNYINWNFNQKKIIYKEYAEEKDLAALYSLADLFIWLSEYEGFGLPPLEAMTLGTLVITTKKGSLPESLDQAALFVEDPKNIDEIAEKIYRGLIDKKLQKELIKRGLEQAKKFSWKKTAKETLFCLLKS